MRRYVMPVIFLLASMPAFGAGFRVLSLPGSQLGVLSADGRSAAGGLVGGTSGGFRWHEGETPEILAGAMSVRAISSSGRYVAGSSLDAGQREVATWWDADGLAHSLGGLPGADARAGVLSVAYGVTDQPRLVGTAINAKRISTAFAWTVGDGMLALAPVGSASGAVGISSDGHRIFGWSERAGTTRHGALWNQGHLCCSVETGAIANEIVGANRGATLLLGFSRENSEVEVPFRWIPEVDSSRTPFAPASASGLPRFTASSDDGRMLVGASGTGAQRVAFIWTEGHGIQRLDAFLATQGIALPAGWTLIAATAVSADGNRLAGFGLKDGRFDSFVIDLPSSARGAAASTSTAP